MVEVEIIRLKPKPGAAGAVVNTLLAARGRYLAPPSCRTVDIMTATNGEVIATVRWASAAAHAQARSTADATALKEEIAKLIVEQPSIELMQEATRSAALAGQVAIVTGGASGIGRAVVDRFVAEGAQVVVVDRNSEWLARIVAEHGSAVLTVTADISTVAGNEAAVATTIKGFGRIDTLVLNAGVFDGFTDFAGVTPDEALARYNAIFGVNVCGAILGASAALPHLVKSNGSIIFTSSIAALSPDGGGLFYVASKHAGLGVMRQLAHELAPHVRVNAVAPGATKTPIGIPDVFGMSLDQESKEVSNAIATMVPMARHAEPADIAGAYVLLASRSDGCNMTGAVITCDGGIGIRGVRRISGGDDSLRLIERASR